MRKAADDILGTLRPLAQVKPHPDIATNDTIDGVLNTLEPAIVDFSVTTFRSHSYQKPRSFLNREAPQYESSMEVQAEFRSFEALGILLAQVSKMPLVNVRSLKWTLDETTKKQLFTKCREQAMADALDKVRAYVRPLGMDKVRATRLDEDRYRQSRLFVMADMNAMRYEGNVESAVMHDEGDIVDNSDAPEAFGLEPQTLEIVAHVDGDFCAWKTGLEAWFRRGGV